MKRIILIILGCINICLAHAQSFNGQYISEWQWDMNRNTNLVNQLRLELSVPIGKGKDSFEAQRCMWQRPTMALLMTGRDFLT